MTLNIKSIALKFLTVGHTQNEGDLMHARIENEANRILKGGPIYEPSQWVSVIKCAKKKKMVNQYMKCKMSIYLI